MKEPETAEVNEMLRRIRSLTPSMIAEELNGVQPMPNDLFKALYAGGRSKAELEADGYEAVSRLGLLYIKKEVEDDAV